MNCRIDSTKNSKKSGTIFLTWSSYFNLGRTLLKYCIQTSLARSKKIRRWKEFFKRIFKPRKKTNKRTSLSRKSHFWIWRLTRSHQNIPYGSAVKLLRTRNDRRQRKLNTKISQQHGVYTSPTAKTVSVKEWVWHFKHKYYLDQSDWAICKYT